jgi:hypothetical protein
VLRPLTAGGWIAASRGNRSPTFEPSGLLGRALGSFIAHELPKITAAAGGVR